MLVTTLRSPFISYDAFTESPCDRPLIWPSDTQSRVPSSRTIAWFAVSKYRIVPNLSPAAAGSDSASAIAIVSPRIFRIDSSAN